MAKPAKFYRVEKDTQHIDAKDDLIDNISANIEGNIDTVEDKQAFLTEQAYINGIIDSIPSLRLDDKGQSTEDKD